MEKKLISTNWRSCKVPPVNKDEELRLLAQPHLMEVLPFLHGRVLFRMRREYLGLGLKEAEEGCSFWWLFTVRIRPVWVEIGSEKRSVHYQGRVVSKKKGALRGNDPKRPPLPFRSWRESRHRYIHGLVDDEELARAAKDDVETFCLIWGLVWATLVWLWHTACPTYLSGNREVRLSLTLFNHVPPNANNE